MGNKGIGERGNSNMRYEIAEYDEPMLIDDAAEECENWLIFSPFEKGNGKNLWLAGGDAGEDDHYYWNIGCVRPSALEGWVGDVDTQDMFAELALATNQKEEQDIWHRKIEEAIHRLPKFAVITPEEWFDNSGNQYVQTIEKIENMTDDELKAWAEAEEAEEGDCDNGMTALFVRGVYDWAKKQQAVEAVK